MASEYLKWLARNEKPAEKRELTPKEKRKNWWHYHKWHVVICIAAVVLIVFMAADIISSKSNPPDYQVAYVGSTYLPDDTVAALETALADLGEDLNGDDQVRVSVNQYVINDDMTSMAGQVQLTAEASNFEIFFYLLEDPAQFQEQFALLAYPDGTLPADGEAPSEALWYSWTDCPVLACLSLGDYEVMTGISGENQDILSTLYIARRGYWDQDDFEHLDDCVALWEKLTAGAKK